MLIHISAAARESGGVSPRLSPAVKPAVQLAELSEEVWHERSLCFGLRYRILVDIIYLFPPHPPKCQSFTSNSSTTATATCPTSLKLPKECFRIFFPHFRHRTRDRGISFVHRFLALTKWVARSLKFFFTLRVKSTHALQSAACGELCSFSKSKSTAAEIIRSSAFVLWVCLRSHILKVACVSFH